MAFDWKPGWRAPFLLRVVGVGMFVVAYFLPAVTGSGGGWNPFVGWSCAYFSGVFLVAAVNNLVHGRLSGQGTGMLVAASGLVNLLVPVFLLVRGWRWKVGVGVVTALLAVVVTPVALHAAQMKAIVGCYLWLGGALLVVVSEFVGVKFGEKAGESA